MSEFPGLSEEKASQALKPWRHWHDEDLDAARLNVLRAARKSREEGDGEAAWFLRVSATGGSKRARDSPAISGTACAWHPDENDDDNTRNARKRTRQDHELREEAKEDVREEFRRDDCLRNEVRAEVADQLLNDPTLRDEASRKVADQLYFDADLIDTTLSSLREDPKLRAEASCKLCEDPKLRDEAVRKLCEDPKLRDEAVRKLYNDAGLRDATRSSLREDPKLRDEAVRKLYNDAGLRDAALSKLREDSTLRDEASRKVIAEERAGRFDSARRTASLDGAWREISILRAGTHYDRFTCVALDLADPVAELLGAMLCKTVRAHRGLPPPQGTGTHFRQCPEFKIVKIERICNPRLQAQYVALRDNYRGKHDNQAVCPLEEVPDFESVEFKRYQRLKNSDFNERFLYHGAPMEHIETICKGGLDHRRAGTNAGALFGIGTYLAEDASKSDIYAAPDSSGLRCILVCRTFLGNTCYMERPDSSLTMPPENLDSVTALRRDEAVDGGRLDHREYIVYDRAQAVPEFRVFYRHAARCKCSQCVL